MLEFARQGAGADEVVPVLLIEDDEADAILVREYLHDAGLGVSLSWQQSLAAATPELKAGPVCVLLDLGLPDSVGFDGLRHVLGLAPDAAVLVLTGAGDASLGLAAMAAGAQDYLIKGQVDGATLSRCIRYAIERKRANDSSRRLHEAEIRQAEYTRLERGLLPVPILNDSSLYHSLRYRPGRDQALLGGDFYDLVQLGDGSLHALIGDVCGHGPDEAALGVCLRVAWRTLVLSGHEPEQTLHCLQEVLVKERHRPEVFATVATMGIDVVSGEGTMHLAGHPPPVLLGTEPHALGGGRPGPPLGLFDENWPAVRFSLGQRWSLLFYTDGLIEGKAGDERRVLGPEGLLELLTTLSSAPSVPGSADVLADSLLETVEKLNGGPMADDLAIIIVGRQP